MDPYYYDFIDPGKWPKIQMSRHYDTEALRVIMWTPYCCAMNEHNPSSIFVSLPHSVVIKSSGKRAYSSPGFTYCLQLQAN